MKIAGPRLYQYACLHVFVVFWTTRTRLLRIATFTTSLIRTTITTIIITIVNSKHSSCFMPLTHTYIYTCTYIRSYVWEHNNGSLNSVVKFHFFFSCALFSFFVFSFTSFLSSFVFVATFLLHNNNNRNCQCRYANNSFYQRYSFAHAYIHMYDASLISIEYKRV